MNDRDLDLGGYVAGLSLEWLVLRGRLGVIVLQRN